MLDQKVLNGFSGTEKYHQLLFPYEEGNPMPSLVLTDGTFYVFEKAGTTPQGGAWLFWTIRGLQSDPRIKGNPLLRGGQFWRFFFAGEDGPELCCSGHNQDGETVEVLVHPMPQVNDFMLDIPEVTIWIFREGDKDDFRYIAILPSEY